MCCERRCGASTWATGPRLRSRHLVSCDYTQRTATGNTHTAMHTQPQPHPHSHTHTHTATQPQSHTATPSPATGPRTVPAVTDPDSEPWSAPRSCSFLTLASTEAAVNAARLGRAYTSTDKSFSWRRAATGMPGDTGGTCVRGVCEQRVQTNAGTH